MTFVLDAPILTEPKATTDGLQVNCCVAARASKDDRLRHPAKIMAKETGTERRWVIEWGSRIPAVCVYADRFE